MVNVPEELIAIFRSARRVAVLTGSGISAESGVPTFRDAQTGLWARYQPEDLATPQVFRRDPALVWEWYKWRRELVTKAKPNRGHEALVELEKYLALRGCQFALITQNVDGLHQRAGSQQVIELHGNILRTKCFDEGALVEKWEESDEKIPRCPQCGGLLRPDVVWFGENLPAIALEAAWQATQSCDIFLCIGTSTIVEPAASLPFMALQYGASVIEINLNTTPLSTSVKYVFRDPAGVILPFLVDCIL